MGSVESATCKPCGPTEDKCSDSLNSLEAVKVVQDEIAEVAITKSPAKEKVPANPDDQQAWKTRLVELSQQVAGDEESDDEAFDNVARSSVILATMRTLGKTQIGASMMSGKNPGKYSSKGGAMDEIKEEDEEEIEKEQREEQIKREAEREKELGGAKDAKEDQGTDSRKPSKTSDGESRKSSKASEDEKCLRRPRRLTATTVKLINTMGRETSNRLQLIIENPRSLETFYEIRSVLGEGAFGLVKKACVKGTGALRAVKSINKARMISLSSNHSFDRLKAELAITKQIDHPNVIKLYEIFEDVTSIHLIMELCWGGELLDRILKAEYFTETQTHHVMTQILRAMYYLHNNNIVHRDMKPQNVLVVTKDAIEKANVKISDFGMATTFKPGVALTAQVGTVAFMAPEVLECGYSELCDIWSCGVIMYMCLCGYLPFLGKSKNETKQKILKKRLNYKMEHWYHVSEDGMALIHHLLRKIAGERISAQEALQSKWIRKHQKATTDVKLQRDLVNRLLTFRGLNKFKRASLQLIVSLLNEKQTGELCEAFMALDVDGDGFLDVNELKDRLENEKQVVRIFQDKDQKDGTLVDYSFTEFLAATFDRERYVQQDVCKAAFTVFDQDGSGDITISELSNGRLLGYLKTDELEKLIEDLDQNGDGKIDFDEFVLMMRERDDQDEVGSPRLRSPSTSPKNGNSAPNSPRTRVERPSTRSKIDFCMNDADIVTDEPRNSGGPTLARKTSPRLSAASTCEETDSSPTMVGRTSSVGSTADADSPSKGGKRLNGLRVSAGRVPSDAADPPKASSPAASPASKDSPARAKAGMPQRTASPKSRKSSPPPKAAPAPAASAPPVAAHTSTPQAPMQKAQPASATVATGTKIAKAVNVKRQRSTSGVRASLQQKAPAKKN